MSSQSQTARAACATGLRPQDADLRHRMLAGHEGVIPAGPYCYCRVRQIAGEPEAKFHILPCPYWATSLEAPDQAYGYCAKLRAGDWDDSNVFLLWEQIKECGLNMGQSDAEDDGSGEDQSPAACA